jgi:reversibly glycosylated polypeptide/UDP-arabinopyranose mutase
MAENILEKYSKKHRPSTPETMLVVPTCRPGSLREFLTAWKGKGGWDAICIIEDAPKRSDEVAEILRLSSLINTQHYSHKEISEILLENSWIISKKDSACRNFGLLCAYWQGMDVITLDDDCFPSNEEDLVYAHQQSMRHKEWVDSIPDQPMRGKPYKNLGNIHSAVNVGLWTKNPDLDAPHQLVEEYDPLFMPPPGNRIIPQGQYVPVCGMNLYIRHAAIPLFYFALMGEGQPYRRFDDIWGGIIAKRILDALGWHMSVGEPFVEHRRASDPFTNLVKEAPGIAANEKFWEIIKSIELSVGTESTPTRLMHKVGSRLSEMKDLDDDYLVYLGTAIRAWVDVCEGGNRI